MRRFLLLVMALWVLPIGPAAATPEVSPALLDAIGASWRKDPVYVYEGLQIPPAELSRIKRAASTLDIPVYVALLPAPGTRYTRQNEFPTLLQGRMGGNGLFMVWFVDDNYWRGAFELVAPLGSKAKSRFSDIRSADDAFHDLINDRPSPTLVRRIQQMDAALSGTALPTIPAADLNPPRRQGPSVTDLNDRAVFVGMGVGALLAFLLLFGRFYRRAAGRPKGQTKAGAKPAAKSTAYAVRSKALARQADAMISRAGRALRKAETRIAKDKATAELLDRRDDARTRLEAARSLRDQTGIEAAAGAFVLARQALTGLAEGVVRPPCFFDPTHLAGTSTVVWSDVEVPACKVCAVAIEAGDEPLSLLVPRPAGLFGRSPGEAPYWSLESDDPLISTGFGALSDDLAERVMSR